MWHLHVWSTAGPFVLPDAGLDAEDRDVKSIEGMADGTNFITAGNLADRAQPVVIAPENLLVAEDQRIPVKREQIKEALSGNLCRCTGCIKITKRLNWPPLMRGEEMELPRGLFTD